MRNEGFATEWVLACSWCGEPTNRGSHTDCTDVIAAAGAAVSGAAPSAVLVAALRASGAYPT